MSTYKVDSERRRFLTGTVAVVGGAGAAAVAVPFLASWTPSERAKAAGAPVQVDVSKLEPGQRTTVEWRKKPVWIVRRTPEMLATLNDVESRLADPNSERPQQPDYVVNEFRSLNPEFLVMLGVCTHLGCAPAFRPEVSDVTMGADWLGGFFCPCHGSRFDLSGRVYSGQPAPSNMEVPPYKFLDDNTVLIGEDPDGEAA